MGDIYPEIKERMEHIASVIRAEEESFNKTLDRGLEIFDKIVTRLKKENKTTISGGDIFKLYDTYGFPFDLTKILSDEAGLTLDSAGFEKEMEAQRERARSSAKFETLKIDDDAWITLNSGKDSQFIGYENLSCDTKIMRYYDNGEQIRIILENTPFYAESGGQKGDQGIISGSGFTLTVTDTIKEGDHTIHICGRIDGFSPASSEVSAQVKESTRRAAAKNHTATHLLHAALRQTLGDHIHQAGSLVDAERLRFDFTHFEKISSENLQKIETLINKKIQENIPLQIKEEKYSEAKKRGAMALFGEKYGDVVRTVNIPGFSFELCGGTHVKATGDIGLVVILSENGIASGVRRIEALSGLNALQYVQQAKNTVMEVNSLLNTAGGSELTGRISAILEENRTLQKEMEKLKAARLSEGIDKIIENAKTINGIKVITAVFKEINTNQLKDMADDIREKNKNITGLLAAENGDKLTLVCFVSDDLIKEKKLNAGNLVKECAKIAGGGGGGRPHLATAGAKDITKIEAVLKKFDELIEG
jgi:alanyl-tRNA synthetase